MGKFSTAYIGGALSVLAIVVLAGCASKGSGVGAAQYQFSYKKMQAALEKIVVKRSDLPIPPYEPDWRRHFKSVNKGAILVELEARRLSFWSPGGKIYREFPIGVPRSEDLERTGKTSVVRRRKNPDWRPTPLMIERNPDLPHYVGPGPENPMGEHAMYLGWKYYAIHGTNHPESIGQRTTSGCIRLFPEHVAWLFDQVVIGTPVIVVDST
jgi:hypothetical protein